MYKISGYLVSFLILLFPICVFAHAPVFVETPEQNEILFLKEPEVSKVFYGDLVGFPHMYEFYTKDPLVLSVQVLVPYTDALRSSISGIILRIDERGRAHEVARLKASEASWDSFFEPFGADFYLRGGNFEGEVGRGLYRIEVSAPENTGKYALSVGKKEVWGEKGYFQTLKDLIRIKQFSGTSVLWIFISPFVYIPLLIVVIGVFLGLWYRRKVEVQ